MPLGGIGGSQSRFLFLGCLCFFAGHFEDPWKLCPEKVVMFLNNFPPKIV